MLEGILNFICDFQNGVHLFGKEKIVVYCLDDLLELVKMYNHRKNCLLSLYSFSEVLDGEVVPESVNRNRRLIVVDGVVNDYIVPTFNKTIVFTDYIKTYQIIFDEKDNLPFDTMIPIPLTLNLSNRKIIRVVKKK